jgi:hypothetical protein
MKMGGVIAMANKRRVDVLYPRARRCSECKARGTMNQRGVCNVCLDRKDAAHRRAGNKPKE